MGPPCSSIRGNVKRKYFSLELKCAEDWSRHSAPSTRFCPVRCDVIMRGRLRPGMRVGCDPGRIFLISAPGRSVVRADHREAEAAAGLYSLPFPLEGMRSSERPGAVKGAPLGAAKRTLEGDHRGRGKADVDSGRFSETRASQTVALCVCQPWFYLRLAAYSFFRLSEGA